MASSRTRVLFIGEAATLAHVARPATLAAALPPEEFDVTLACDSHYGALFQNLPFPVHAVRIHCFRGWVQGALWAQRWMDHRRRR
jgi:UDP:flavonoid glycosyltransferase YjiC (YdhE family)